MDGGGVLVVNGDSDIRESWASGRSLVLYGAGGAGRLVARALKVRGIVVTAFLDTGAVTGEVKDGIPVYTLATNIPRLYRTSCGVSDVLRVEV